MSRTARALCVPTVLLRAFPRAAGRRRLIAAVALVAGLSAPGAASAGPLKTTSFVRGTAVAQGAYPGAIRTFAGDFDGDGRDDLIFGNTRDAWLVYGTSPSADVDLSTDLGSRGWRTGDLSTGVYDVDAAGDFDGDGVDDVLIGTDYEVYVVYGSRTRRTGTLTLNPGGTPPAGVTRITTSISAQGDTTGIGDFNGDGFDDVAVQRGYPGSSIILGGPRVASISGTTQGARTSLINATQRCAWIWFTYKCVPLGVNIDTVGDFDGDGKDDLELENSGADGNLILYGRTGAFTIQAVAQSGVTRLPNGQTGDMARIVGNYQGVGDVNGDGRGDVVGWNSVLVYGRTGRPASIARTSSLVTLNPGSLRDAVVERAGDQNGDGRDDLAVYASSPGGPVRVVTSFPAAPATVDLSSGVTVAGLPADVGMSLEGGGDLDGDGLGDLLVPSAYPNDSTYVLTHGTGSPGSVSRPASLEGGIRLLDALGNAIYEFGATLNATCAGRSTSVSVTEFGWAVPLGDYSEGDDCTVVPSIQLANPAAYNRCVWKDSYTLAYDEPLQPGAPFKLSAGKNHWELERRCELPTTDYPAGFEATGWTYSGAAHRNEYLVDLTNLAPNEAGSAMWASPLDYRNRTIEFNVRIAGGTGSSEGMTVAFVRPTSSGQPEGGRLGGIGSQLGFGGLGGVAVALDTKADPGDRSANFVGFTDGVSGSGLRWLATGQAGAAIREPGGHLVRIANKNGRTAVSIDGKIRLNTALPVPPSAFLAFTAATGSLYQLHSVWALKITPS